jgi:type I restriction enzyme S subunit
MNDMPAIDLGSALDSNGVSYGIVQPGQADPAGVPIVRVADMLGDRIRQEEPLRVAKGVEAAHARTRLRGGEVLVTIVGTVGRVAVASPELAGWNVARAVAVLRPRVPTDASWIRYALLAPAVQEQMQVRKTDTVQATLNLRDVKKLSIPWPEETERWRIAAVLDAIDELIETDRSQLARLESVARTVAATAREIVELRAFAEPVATKQVRPSGVTEHYSLPAFDECAMPEQVAGDQIQSNKLPLTEPCVLVSRLNPKWERCWMAYPGANAVASTEFVPLTGTRAAAEEVWAVASATEFWDQMRTHVTGTTGSHQRVDKAAVLTLAVPDVRTIPELAKRQVIANVQSAHALREEIVDLTRVRDELLPLLMSGKVRVSEDIAVA